jgi:mRNA-degrading endonuclease RelE of RelBE toxin-antitoxin system
MAWSSVLSRRALRDLEDLDADTQAMILARIRAAASGPSSVDMRKLAGRANEWRIRAGAWRIIVELDSSTGTMTVLRVLNRRDAYR